MLRSQAHCQVARKSQRTTQNLAKSLPAPPQKDKNAQLLTAAHTPLPTCCFIRKLLVNLSPDSFKKIQGKNGNGA
jgi:hypothetical protein